MHLIAKISVSVSSQTIQCFFSSEVYFLFLLENRCHQEVYGLQPIYKPEIDSDIEYKLWLPKWKAEEG